MRNISTEFLSELRKPAREVGAYLTFSYTNERGVVVTTMLNPTNWLKSIKREAVLPDSKYFGFYVTHKITLELVEYNGSIPDIKEGLSLKLYYDTKEGYSNTTVFPEFIVKETSYNDTTKVLTVTAYDRLYSHLDETIGEDISTVSDVYDLMNLLANKVLGGSRYTYDSVTIPDITDFNLTSSDTIGNIITWLCEVLGCYCELGINGSDDYLMFKIPQELSGDIQMYSIDEDDNSISLLFAVDDHDSVTFTSDTPKTIWYEFYQYSGIDPLFTFISGANLRNFNIRIDEIIYKDENDIIRKLSTGDVSLSNLLGITTKYSTTLINIYYKVITTWDREQVTYRAGSISSYWALVYDEDENVDTYVLLNNTTLNPNIFINDVRINKLDGRYYSYRTGGDLDLVRVGANQTSFKDTNGTTVNLLAKNYNRIYATYPYVGSDDFKSIEIEYADLTPQPTTVDLSNDDIINSSTLPTDPVIPDNPDEPVNPDTPTDINGTYIIYKSDYYEIKLGEQKKLSSISITNDLGDTTTIGDDTGYQQKITNNPIFEKIDDTLRSTILTNIISNYQYNICPINLLWRGNPALELGDIISIELKDGSFLTVPYIYGTFDYNGGYKETIDWSRVDGSSNSISRIINNVKQTTKAEIDKANLTITLLSNKTDDIASETSEIKVSLGEITQSVSSTQQQINNTNDALNSTNESINTLTQQVLQLITPENVLILINETLANGINEVTTSTGFKFDKNGLNVTKTGSPMSSLLDEDGLKVSNTGVIVLVANNQGCEAINLTAKQYLIIGTTSRFLDYLDSNNKKRTGCFWIG